MDAGSVSRDGDVLTAEGPADGARVFARFRDHTLQARRIDYDLANQTASASRQQSQAQESLEEMLEDLSAGDRARVMAEDATAED